MSTTHHYEANQRLVWLQILNRGANDITVSAPINSKIAPPGYYMIHVLNSMGVPSVARIIRIPGVGTGAGTAQTFYNVPIPGNAAAALYSGSSVRFGEEAFNSSSLLIGKSLKSWKVRLRKTGIPVGFVTAKIRKNPGDSIAATFNEQINSSNLGTAFAEYTFTLTNPYVIQKGDRILVEYNGPAAVHMEIWNVEKFDSFNTRRIRYNGTSYISGGSEDVTGTMSTK
jgi:hypothetical protein